jgi:hypothetical protein
MQKTDTTPDFPQWRVAYARQALSDLDAREKLDVAGLPHCHHLHYLQMACEKICKAYLCGRGVDPALLRKGHGFVAGPLPIIVREQIAEDSKKLQRSTWLIISVTKLCKQIELLAPSMDDGGRMPANCEYPWQDSRGRVITPAEHNFRFDLLDAPAGRQLLRSLRRAAQNLSTIESD